ncbi:hypothetical protein [Capnocytophaga canis]|uniref:hypothetical protein n=1 Tax=Capnocytophaga canis TaxID=1848903 RepID=UPI0037D3B9EC
MIDFFERLDNFMIFKGLNDNKMTIETGISNGLIGKARKKGGGISLENISKILNTYSELSAEWLITGKGEMLKKESAIAQNGTNNIVQNGNKSKAKIISTEENVCFLREKIALLEEKEALYKDKITYLTQEIERLKSSN